MCMGPSPSMGVCIAWGVLGLLLAHLRVESSPEAVDFMAQGVVGLVPALWWAGKFLALIS